MIGFIALIPQEKCQVLVQHRFGFILEWRIEKTSLPFVLQATRLTNSGKKISITFKIQFTILVLVGFISQNGRAQTMDSTFLHKDYAHWINSLPDSSHILIDSLRVSSCVNLRIGWSGAPTREYFYLLQLTLIEDDSFFFKLVLSDDANLQAWGWLGLRIRKSKLKKPAKKVLKKVEESICLQDGCIHQTLPLRVFIGKYK